MWFLLNVIKKYLFFFLIDDIIEIMMEDILKGKRVYEMKRKKKFGIMFLEIKCILDNFYYLYLCKLYVLINDDCFFW